MRNPAPLTHFPKQHDQSYTFPQATPHDQTSNPMDFCLLFFQLSQQPLPLSTSVISSTVFKQTAVSFHKFSTNKEEADADANVDANAYAEARSRFVAFLPLSSILSFFFYLFPFFFFFWEDLMFEIILSNVCFVIFWEPSDLCSVLKTGRFDRGLKGSLKI